MITDPPRRGGGPAKIYETLKTEILGMVLAPGSALDEASLSARFAMSRTPVREALHRLVAEGLATALPNRSTVVTALDFAGVPQYLDALTLMYRMTCRSAAARQPSATVLVPLVAAQARYAAAVAAADAIAMLDSNRDFHMAIAALGGNRYYIDLLDRLLNDGMRLLRLYYRTFHDQLPRQFSDEHDQMIAVIAAGDVDGADRLGTDHAAQITGQLRRFLLPDQGGEIRLS